MGHVEAHQSIRVAGVTRRERVEAKEERGNGWRFESFT